MNSEEKPALYTSSVEGYAKSILGQPFSRQDQAQSRERIIAAAICACAKDGPLDFKVAEIAEIASASTATIYREFENATAVLRHATLKAVAILSQEWASTDVGSILGSTEEVEPTDKVRIKNFLMKFGETYRHPFSGWLLRADLAIAANQDPDVTGALMAFQNQIVAVGIACLPQHTSGSSHSNDLVQILLGATQLPIINAILAAPTGVSETSIAQGVDLEQKITSILAWLGIDEHGQNNQSWLTTGIIGTTTASGVISKSAMQIYCETILAQNGKRTDYQLRRIKMIAATMTDCAAVGLEGTSISRIAKIARVSSASIYREFEDKNALIQASIAHAIPVYAQATMIAVDEVDPKIRMAKLLSAQAMTLADPFGVWLFRHYTKLEASHNPEIKQKAQAARAQSVAFWNKQLQRLNDEGHLVPTDHGQTRDMVFGGIHRRSVLARLLQNDNAYVWAEVEASVSAATNMLFGLYGKQV